MLNIDSGSQKTVMVQGKYSSVQDFTRGHSSSSVSSLDYPHKEKNISITIFTNHMGDLFACQKSLLVIPSLLV